MKKIIMSRSKRQEPTRNDKWIALLSAADQGAIDAREAILGATEHYDAVYGSNFAAVVKMLEEQDKTVQEILRSSEETRQKATAGAANGTIIREYLDRQEVAVKELQSFLQTQLSGFAARVDALESATNQVWQRVNENSDRIAAIDRFVQEFATLPSEVRNLRTTVQSLEGKVETLTHRMDESAADRRHLNEVIEADRKHFDEAIEEVKRLLGGDD